MRRPRTRTIVVGILGLVIAMGALGGSHSRWTCALCRLTRHNGRVGLIPWVREVPNECSQWYEDHVEPRHEHLWQQSPFSQSWSLLASVCAGRHASPIWDIPSGNQLAFYRHLGDPQEGKRFFLNLSDRAFYEQRLDDHDYPSKGYIMADAINAWVRQDFPGTWPEWWAKAWQEHVREHEIRMITRE